MAEREPVRVADCFLLAMDAFMRRHGQGTHLTASVLVLERTPDLPTLTRALGRMAQKHPLLSARLHRHWRTWLPYWEMRERTGDEALPFRMWKGDSPATFEDILAEPLPAGWNARFDLLERPDGTCLAALSWSHVVLDGKGAELLLEELARLCAGIDEPCEARETVRPETTWQEKVRKRKPAVRHLETLARLPMRSVCGPRPRAGRCRFQVVTLEGAMVEKVQARVERMAGALFPLTYYIACAARAHDRVLAHRGAAPGGYVTTVPVQTRKRGARGPLFHNHVSVLFFGGPRAQLATLDMAAAAMKEQFAAMSRARLDESFLNLLELMMRAPSRLFMFIVRHQFRGEICSFFQSHTGAFAPGLVALAGARVRNAYHLPSVSAPPGSGIFFCEHSGRLNVAFSWRESCLTADERRLLVATTLEDLVGEPCRDVTETGLALRMND
jgi:hypothetical protein